MFDYFVINGISRVLYCDFVKPPVGIPGVDNFCVQSLCEKCNKHFLIAEEIKDHQRVCMN
jgi:hypothetical protein